jgi:putative FmdB family regulatory protein
MPIYEYHCDSCDTRFERLQRLDDPPLAACEECGGPVRKLISAPAFQFKGSGWYVTDYARKGTSGGTSDGSSQSESKSDDKPASKESKDSTGSKDSAGSKETKNTTKDTKAAASS